MGFKVSCCGRRLIKRWFHSTLYNGGLFKNWWWISSISSSFNGFFLTHTHTHMEYSIEDTIHSIVWDLILSRMAAKNESFNDKILCVGVVVRKSIWGAKCFSRSVSSISLFLLYSFSTYFSFLSIYLSIYFFYSTLRVLVSLIFFLVLVLFFQRERMFQLVFFFSSSFFLLTIIHSMLLLLSLLLYADTTRVETNWIESFQDGRSRKLVSDAMVVLVQLKCSL